MKIGNMSDIAYALLEDVGSVLVQLHGEKYKTVLTRTDIGLTLTSDDFMITYPNESLTFFLSFKVGLFGKTISTLTRDILTVLTPTELVVVDDSYYDKQEDELKFGFDALEARQRDLLLKQGTTKCPVCERVYDNKNINSDGICKYCNLDTMVWH